MYNPSTGNASPTCDCDEHGARILSILILHVQPELPAVPSLGVLDPQAAEGVAGLDVEVAAAAARDGLVLEEPNHLIEKGLQYEWYITQ